MCKTEIEEITSAITKKIAEETDRLVEKVLIEKGYATRIKSQEDARKILAQLEKENKTIVTRVKVNIEIGTITLFVDLIPRSMKKEWYETLERELGR